MNPEQRRQRAAEIAAELNADEHGMLLDDLKFLLTDRTATRLFNEPATRKHTGSGNPAIRTQFDRQPEY